MRKPVVVLLVAVSLAGCDDKEDCSNRKDDDGNGLVDCADPGCGPGAICGPSGAACGTTGACDACSGNGGVAEAPEATCGDGFDNDCDGLIDCNDPDCQPTGTAPGKVCDAAGHVCSAKDVTGRSTCTGNPGSGGGGGSTEPPALGSITPATTGVQVLGAQGSGYHERALATFQLSTAYGTPYPPGLPVSFTHASQGGSFIGTTPDCDAATPPLCRASGVTDADGRVQVLVNSGSRFGILSIGATATGGGVARSQVSDGFVVVGAKPSGAYLSLDCELHNVPAFTDHDCLYSWYDGPGSTDLCTLKMADRHGIVIGARTMVAFQAEAGALPPAAFSPDYDPARPVADQRDLGHAVGWLETYDAPMPTDVAPFPGEHSQASVDLGCGPSTLNPRDGLVTVVAMVQGEEGFVDKDLNGRYDPGEPFIDLGEPFVDANDDGAWEPGEWYLDANGDGAYTGPNGEWDADTIIWTQTRVLYSGYPAALHDAVANAELVSRLYTVGAPPAPTPPAPAFSLLVGGTTSYGVYLADARFNPISPTATYSAETLTGKTSAKLLGPAPTIDTLGSSFRLLYCGSQTDPATCADGPAASACKTSPCYVVPDVGRCQGGSCAGFQYGSYGELGLTCGKEPGTDTASVVAELNGVRTYLGVKGECLAPTP